jgi:hypothetical protein
MKFEDDEIRLIAHVLLALLFWRDASLPVWFSAFMLTERTFIDMGGDPCSESSLPVEIPSKPPQGSFSWPLKIKIPNSWPSKSTEVEASVCLEETGLKQRMRICGIDRPLLYDIPMLNHTCPVKAKHVYNGSRFRVQPIHPVVHPADRRRESLVENFDCDGRVLEQRVHKVEC